MKQTLIAFYIFSSSWLITVVALPKMKIVSKTDSLINLAEEAKKGRNYNLATSNYLKAIELSAKKNEKFKTGSAWFHLAWVYYLNYQDSLALVANSRALQIFQNLDSIKQQAVTYNRLGQYLSGMGLNKDAINAYIKARDLHLIRADSLSAGQCLNNIGLVYYDLGEYQKSLAILYEALSLKENFGETDKGISSTLLNIGTVLDVLKKHDEALIFYERTINYKIKVGDSLGIARVLGNMAVINKTQDRYDQAIDLIRQSNAILNRFPEDELLYTNQTTLGNIFKKQSKFSEAKFELDKALKLAIKLDNKNWIGESYQNLGGIYYEIGEFKEAIKFNKLALELVVLTDSYGQRMEIHENLAKGYAAISDFNQAHKNLTLTLQYRDSVYRLEQIKATEELHAKYETQKKERQIELQQISINEQKARLQRNRILIGSLITVTVLLLIIVILIRNQAKRKHELLKKEASLKLQQAEITAVINSQEKERNRFARDLHDGFGQMISILKMNISNLDQEQNDASKLAALRQSNNVIDEMYDELRNICFDLMPQTLMQQGLSAALEEFGNRVSQTAKVDCKVMIFDEYKRLSEFQEVSIFRIVQEWVNNVLKYAQASEISIQLTRDETEVTLTIEDNGQGFNSVLFYAGKGNGWKNIQTRLKQINGTFDLDTHEGSTGTMVTINVVHSYLRKIPITTDDNIRF